MPSTLITESLSVTQSLSSVSSPSSSHRCGLELYSNFFHLRNRQKLVRIRFENIWYIWVPIFTSILLQHNIARPHSANATITVIHKLNLGKNNIWALIFKLWKNQRRLVKKENGIEKPVQEYVKCLEKHRDHVEK